MQTCFRWSIEANFFLGESRQLSTREAGIYKDAPTPLVGCRCGSGSLDVRTSRPLFDHLVGSPDDLVTLNWDGGT
jgi:hypothetical protein